jgi:NTP pyrophosphatase (non-canonical NTP hydrolase)
MKMTVQTFRWISVDEALPEPYNVVIVWPLVAYSENETIDYRHDKSGNLCWMATYDDGQESLAPQPYNHPITHWMYDPYYFPPTEELPTTQKPQQAIFDAVQARGYVTGNTPFDVSQQVLKALEEVCELAAGLPDLPANDADAIRQLGQRARHLFDNAQSRLVSNIDTDTIVSEVPDVVIPLFVLCQMLGVDLQAVAMEKAERDVVRGKRV